MTQFVLAIDQGTTSTRAMVFNREAQVHAFAQKEHRQIFPRAGWVEHDPQEIWLNTREVVGLALARGELTPTDIAAVGITNQRETTVIWDRQTGEPIYNAIVWQDTRTQDICDDLAQNGGTDRYRTRVGLPLATYFSAPKMRWILDHVPGAQSRAEAGELAAGTIDSWLLWNMTGGARGGIHVTDVTNASRTMLLDLHTLEWDPEIATDFGLPLEMLPEVRSSSEEFGFGRRGGLLPDVPLTAVLGDQHAATVGQTCFEKGSVKNTYGTGNFLLVNTGAHPVASSHGLLTTIAYRFGNEETVYALEGSIAVTGSLVQWLRDNLGFFASAPEIEKLAGSVPDNGGAYFVPAFSGLFAPYWRADARGALVGLTAYVTRAHIARAALEATAFQTRDVLEAIRSDTGLVFDELRVDGGMVENDLLLQFQADILGLDVVRPRITETTALGAAYAAGLAVGFWADVSDVVQNWHEDKRWKPRMPTGERNNLYGNWQKAVSKSLDWIE
ncbi:MAG TPA: glycerol kinase GlpK [Actinomycetales bacterium]|nr:glycerol kinase GlpK [Actinomycetales bacterium]